VARFLQYFILLFLFSTVAQAYSTRAEIDLLHLLSRYKTYRAQFIQKTYWNDHQPVQVQSGFLYIKRPGQFRWEIRRPSRQVIIANQSFLWIYDIDLKQVTKQKVNQYSNDIAVLFSSHLTSLIKHYNITKINDHGNTWYQLKPRSSQANFIVIRMQFSKNYLVAVWVENNLGQKSNFQFSHIQLNRPLSTSLFNFKPPRGVDILQ